MEELKDSHKFRMWRSAMESNGVDITQIRELETIWKKNGNVLFSMLEMSARDPQGNPMLPVVFLRGHFVSVLTVLTDQDSGERFLLLVAQRRVANGAVFYEHPAGMCDSEANPVTVAIAELEEETGLKIEPDQLTQLNEELFFTSPGLLDEGGWFFSCELTLTRKEIEAIHGQRFGDEGQHEFIRTHVVPYQKAPELIRNTSGLVNIFLYESLG